MVIKKLSKTCCRLTLVGISLCLCMGAFGGLSQPPLMLFGSLETLDGDPLMAGTIEFWLTPVGQEGPAVEAAATLGQLAEEANFLLQIPVETAPVSDPGKALKASSLYEITITFNGQEVDSIGIPSPLSPVDNSMIGPVLLRMSPTGPILRVSENIQFDPVLVGEYIDDSITVSNTGGDTLTGTVKMKTGEHFRLIEEGITVSVVSFSLIADGSREIGVRFQPVVPGAALHDVLWIRTNAADTDRYLDGMGLVITLTPTPVPTATPTPVIKYLWEALFEFSGDWYKNPYSGPSDKDHSGHVDEIDLIELIMDNEK
jgi:hypothetical protein